ncbi:reverse transcriptase family protein [Bacillus cereus group sp. MYBK249-1]|uniref:reverse transcriptase family protein n=1 Tax=Bacillus cereus group TaxID=86661 RepID=UPI000BF7BFAB|nr:reverse transcriptase family protein [Bacillus cereus]MDA2072856.1 reverse transcriptase family protein [Bacillus cereus]PET25188.1 RNA-dependent DNA polymerase [Bacillus cereus]PFI11464.1 RNA-dependent DNA polymerase [Bacillus cereus]PFO55860.1 RNA-dependent DNA polymerase [Bacillus cereus]HDR6217356.1 RNA-directed DNA polymerase [Bacillus cereus]
MDIFDEVPMIEDINNFYDTFNIQVNKKQRTINAVKQNSLLRKLQDKLLKNFLENIPLSDCVCGFVKGKNYLDFLIPHCEKKYFLRIDIKDFFNSLKEKSVRENIREYIDIKEKDEKENVLDEIVAITTLNGSLPQGAITSPQLSNILMRRIDIRIRKYCEKFKVEYTRYADDMLFSSDSNEIHKSFFIGKLKEILKDMDLRINSKKVIKTNEKIILNGYVVSHNISLTRKKLKKLNTLLYAFEYKGSLKKYPLTFSEYIRRLQLVNPSLIDLSRGDDWSKIQIINYLAGYRSFLLSFNSLSIKDYTCNFSNRIKRTEKMLETLSILK